MKLLTKLAFLAKAESGDLGIEKGEDAQGFLESLLEVVYGSTVQIIIGLLLTLVLIVKGVMVGMKIVKAADDTSARKEAIDSLKYMIIGVGVVAILYYGSGALINLFF